MAACDAAALEAEEQQARALPPRRLRQRSGGRAALLLAAVGLLPVALGPWGLSEAESTQAGLLPEPLKKDKVLFQKQGYELRLSPRRSNSPVFKAVPKIVFRKIPPQPISLVSASGSLESNLDKEIAGFPFTTSNTGSLALGFPRAQGVVKLSLKDPPASDDDVLQSAEISYEQALPGAGQVGARVTSKGDWVAFWNHKVEDIGNLRTTLNSQLDWSADLDTTYPAVKGIHPTVSYGATQDGMRVRAKVDGGLANAYGSYQVQNEAGKYQPRDLVHDARVVYTQGRNSIEADGKYDRRLPKRPFKGSLSYVARTKPGTLTASVDLDRYRLKADTGYAQVSAAVAHNAGDGKGYLGGRPTEFGVRTGPVSAEVRLNGSRQPRVRLEVAA